MLANSNIIIGATTVNLGSNVSSIANLTSMSLIGSTSGNTILQANATASGTITFPNVSGNVVTTGDIGTVTNNMLAGSISDSKLNTITTAGKVSNSATTATSSNTANTIILRDSSGNFNAGTISANLNGNLSITNSLISKINYRDTSLVLDSTYSGNSFFLGNVSSDINFTVPLSRNSPGYTYKFVYIGDFATSGLGANININLSFDIDAGQPDYYIGIFNNNGSVGGISFSSNKSTIKFVSGVGLCTSGDTIEIASDGSGGYWYVNAICSNTGGITI